MGEAQSKITASIGAGLLCSTLSHPMDTIKTCMQGDMERKTYRGLTETARVLYEQGGPGRFFNGWSWRTGRMICDVLLLSELKIHLSKLLFPRYFVEEEE